MCNSEKDERCSDLTDEDYKFSTIQNCANISYEYGTNESYYPSHLINSPKAFTPSVLCRKRVIKLKYTITERETEIKIEQVRVVRSCGYYNDTDAHNGGCFSRYAGPDLRTMDCSCNKGDLCNGVGGVKGGFFGAVMGLSMILIIQWII